MTTFTEHPPVPQVLQVALKDYPELIAELQDGLTRVGLRPRMTREQRTDEFERTIWSLEGDLEDFMINAAAEVRAAEATGDAERIAKAKEKEMLMSGCRHDKSWIDELMIFFRWGQD